MLGFLILMMGKSSFILGMQENNRYICLVSEKIEIDINGFDIY
jgi:hypothetical protein